MADMRLGSSMLVSLGTARQGAERDEALIIRDENPFVTRRKLQHASLGL